MTMLNYNEGVLTPWEEERGRAVAPGPRGPDPIDYRPVRPYGRPARRVARAVRPRGAASPKQAPSRQS
jgi:hypothetical protein